MLVPTKTGFVEIVKEPQFEEIFTVQATDMDSARLFRKHTQARLIFNDYSRTYRFLTYAYPLDISAALCMPFRPQDVQELDKNISPAPVGYRCLGFWHDRDEDVQLDVLAEELEAFQQGHDLDFDGFRAWPIFHLTDELAAQKDKTS